MREGGGGGVQVRKTSSLTRGASVMVASVTAAKLLGLIYLFPLTRLIHDEGIGIYSNAYALYVILLTLATAGFPTAMGKLVSERLALRRYGEVEGLYRITVRTVVRLGVILAILMWFGAPLYARMVALRESAQAVSALTLSIRALAPALLVVPLMSALRGYLQGFQRLEPSAYSQALEQLVRVVAIVIGAWWVMRGGGTPALGPPPPRSGRSSARSPGSSCSSSRCTRSGGNFDPGGAARPLAPPPPPCGGSCGSWRCRSASARWWCPSPVWWTR